LMDQPSQPIFLQSWPGGLQFAQPLVRSWQIEDYQLTMSAIQPMVYQHKY
jgi:hypothetical protein